MFSSWDLVRPRFWYPMSSLEQSMMELEQMRDSMMRPRSLFDMRRDMLLSPRYAEDKERPVDDDFFVDLPVASNTYKSTPFHMAPKQNEKVLMNEKDADNASLDTDTSTDMEVEDKDSENVDKVEDSATKAVKTSKKVNANDNIRKKHRNKNKQIGHDSYKVIPTTERHIAPKSDAECRNFSSYSFSSSSVLDGMGQQVTTTRRRYEDSTGRLKAVHEREIGDKKLRTTWRRQSKEDEGQHESMCSSGNPDEFEALWQQTPFGEAQKKTVKGRLQSESDVQEQVVSTLENIAIDENPAETTSAKKIKTV